MPVSIKNQVSFPGAILCLTFLLIFSLQGYSQEIQIADSSAAKQTESSMQQAVSGTGNNYKPGRYETYRIFSFNSADGYFPSLLYNFGEQARAPFGFNLKEWLFTGAAIGVTAALISADGRIDKRIKPLKERYDFVNNASPVVTEFGNTYGVCLVGAIACLSAAFNDRKGVQTSLLASQAILTSGTWIQLIKLFTGRERPKAAYLYSQTSSGKWYGPFARFNSKLSKGKSVFAFDSFPSGHTAFAFSIATVFATQYKEIKAIPVICYSAASVIGVTRLIEHEHWASDVFAGALFGYLCGKQVAGHFNDKSRNSGNRKQGLRPGKGELTLVGSGSGIGLHLSW
jgi:hypothetical protein